METLSRNLESACEKLTVDRHGGVAGVLRLGWCGVRDPCPGRKRSRYRCSRYKRALVGRCELKEGSKLLHRLVVDSKLETGTDGVARRDEMFARSARLRVRDCWCFRACPAQLRHGECRAGNANCGEIRKPVPTSRQDGAYASLESYLSRIAHSDR